MANQDHLKILHQGVKAWNDWRSANADIRPDLSGADFTGADLRDANLSGANLSGADLRGARLRDADLRHANLRDANLSGADLRDAVLRDANLCGANLYGADLFDADLSGANLTGADLTGADLFGADLSGANLSEANLSGADLRGAVLRGADLSGAILSGANLSGADLFGADLDGANFTHANLGNAVLDRAAQANPTITEAMLQMARFSDIDEPEEIAEQMELTASPGNPPPGNADMVSEGTEISGSHIGPAPAAVRPVAPDDQEANQQAALDALRQLQTDLSPMVGYDQETRPGSNAPELPLSQDQLDLLRGFVAAEIALLGAPIMDNDTRNIIQKITMKLREIEELLKAANAVNKQASKLLITLGLTIAAILRFIH
ncbi:MAG TPA: hypothetical protein DCO73_09860 [Alphaproteobacteria bacterium]|nr:hypothetical protein [Alphaproteobacteria bacterium]